MWEQQGSLYTVRRIGNVFHVKKFDEHFNYIKTYHVRQYRSYHYLCDRICPQHEQPKCKHRTLVKIFIRKERVNKGWFYDWHLQLWEPPLTSLLHRMYDRVYMREV